MIAGVGIDIIEVGRIEASYGRFGERFINRILLAEEIHYCLSHKAPGPFLAARFAAKEAISKAFGTGIGAQLGWHDMEIRRKQSGEPFVVLHGKGKKLLEERNARAVFISLSHTQNHAAAVAVLEGAP
jgi:holo-[acyl-carrier protein] synthase